MRKGRNKINGIGEENFNKYGDLMKIIEYNDSLNIVVEFQDSYKYKVKTQYQCFKNGTIKNPYKPTVYGVGCLGNSKTTINGVMKKSYIYWNSMLTRCYAKNKKDSYKDKFVCDEWLCYENFEKWFDENYYEIEGERIELDKDILFKGNKIYSPETCVFVPLTLNNMFVCQNMKKENGLPLGVGIDKKAKTYYYCLNLFDKKIKAGGFKTSDEAFKGYKKEKEKHIKETVIKYKNKIPKNIYDIILNYEI